MKPVQTIDSIRPPAKRPTRPIPHRTPENHSAPRPTPKPLPATRVPKSHVFITLKFLGFLAISTAGLLLLAFLGTPGQLLAALIALALLICKIPSRLIFSLALLAVPLSM